MGRGRAKAKQTKVARRLKYYSPDTDLTALERELAAGHEGYPSLRPSGSDVETAKDDDADDDPLSDGDYDAWASGER